ncbi:protein arginine kinase [Pectinatus haikarae]|uniref:Protein arginine kinase n=1 Tax=Pectinatus haikarae TaxID=349096 RepID=A0ABT9Y6D6_9FIRM|nr:protein arginine kinase [Pectinatus haikarae]MDQ0202767.1 protein arginine kinase [Pectinatus haikarae]
MMLQNIFTDNNITWMDGKGTDSDIVLLSRIRLARNFKDLPFPNRASTEQLADARSRLLSVLDKISATTKTNYICLDMDKLTDLQKRVLVEKHLISGNFTKHSDSRSLIVNADSDISIMVNEDDHLRIQCMKSGLDLSDPMMTAFDTDNCIEEEYDIAFDDNMGYLTACPTNLGTGLRASVLLHLPGLAATNQIAKIINISPQLGLAVRGFYGSNAPGNLFQIANQLSLGFNEKELTENLSRAVQEIVSHEREARRALLAYAEDKVCDQAWRALGILKYARSLSERELLSLVSNVRIGIDEKIITSIDVDVFNKLIIAGRTNYLTNLQEKENMSQREIDKKRADIAREIISDSSSDKEVIS